MKLVGFAFANVVRIIQALLFLRAVLSWFPKTYTSRVSYILADLTEPVVAPVRKILSRMVPGGIMDFSFLVTFLVLELCARFTEYIFGF